jgi:hypothetical protein
MLIKWFDAREAKQFGISLAEFVIEKMPPDYPGKKRLSATKKQEILNKLFERAMRFKLEQKLNVYKKSQLGNAFKWTLTSAGYNPGFVNDLTLQILLKLR